MHPISRKVIAALIWMAFAGCAEAPDLDEAFLVGRSLADAGGADDPGAVLDAGPGGTLGGIDTSVLGGLDAGGQLSGLGGPGGATAGIDSGAGGGGLDGAWSAPDTSVVAPADTGTGSSTDAASPVPGAGGGTTGGGTFGGSASGGGAFGGGTFGGSASGGGATCNPATCNNECLLLERCCNENDECACLTPLTRQCTLPSL